MYTILGYGEQGRAIVHYLLKNTGSLIQTVDPYNAPKEEYFKYKTERWEHWLLDQEHENWEKDLKKHKSRVVINCLSTKFSLDIAARCIQGGHSYLDLGGDTSVSRQIGDLYKENVLATAVPDCGIAPGLVSSIAKHGQDTGYQSVYLYCGGLPAQPNNLPLGYIKSFSSQGVIKEYTGVAECRVEDKLAKFPTLSGIEYIYLRGHGVLEAQLTSGGISTAAECLDLKNLVYKTLRYPGHWNCIEKSILVQPDPITVLDNILDPVSRKNPDIILLHAVFKDHFDPKTGDVTRTWQWIYDHENNISAMAQATGYTAAKAAIMIHENKLPKGLIHMHDIPLENFWNIMPASIDE